MVTCFSVVVVQTLWEVLSEQECKLQHFLVSTAHIKYMRFRKTMQEQQYILRESIAYPMVISLVRSLIPFTIEHFRSQLLANDLVEKNLI